MFDFNDVIENNNIIDNIQHDFLDINVMFFNCYKLLIKQNYKIIIGMLLLIWLGVLTKLKINVMV